MAVPNPSRPSPSGLLRCCPVYSWTMNAATKVIRLPHPDPLELAQSIRPEDTRAAVSKSRCRQAVGCGARQGSVKPSDINSFQPSKEAMIPTIRFWSRSPWRPPARTSTE